MPKPESHRREAYFHFSRTMTKLHDIDIYGHLNNNLYHQFFDNAVNRYLTLEGGLSMHHSEIIGVMVNSGCDYLREIQWPDHEELEIGIRVDWMQRSSVRYGGAMFVPGEDEARAQGHLIHVWIERATQTPVPIPKDIRAAMEKILFQPGAREGQSSVRT